MLKWEDIRPFFNQGWLSLPHPALFLIWLDYILPRHVSKRGKKEKTKRLKLKSKVKESTKEKNQPKIKRRWIRFAICRNVLRCVPLSHSQRWVVSRQMRFEGGFQGRCNKLVDGCYSFWQAGLLPLLHRALFNEGTMTQGWGSEGAASLLNRWERGLPQNHLDYLKFSGVGGAALEPSRHGSRRHPGGSD